MTKTLTIHLTKTKKVGTLAIRDKKIYFEYDKDFLKTNIELSPYKLPLKAGLFQCNDDTFDGLWGLFNDSLPDGWGRFRSRYGTSLSRGHTCLLDRSSYSDCTYYENPTDWPRQFVRRMGLAAKELQLGTRDDNSLRSRSPTQGHNLWEACPSRTSKH